MSEIYRETITLQRTLDLQSSTASLKERRRAVAECLGRINNYWISEEGRAAHAKSAYFIDDRLTFDSYICPTKKFGEIILKGTVPRLACIEVSDRLVLALPFFDSVILGPKVEIEPELIELEMDEGDVILPLGKEIRRPLYVPVEDMVFITFTN